MIRKLLQLSVVTLVVFACSSGDSEQSEKPATPQTSQVAKRVSPAEGFKLVGSNLHAVDTSAAMWTSRFELAVKSESPDSISLKSRLRVLDEKQNILYEEIIRGMGLPSGIDTTFSGLIRVPADSMRKFHSFSVDMARETE